MTQPPLEVVQLTTSFPLDPSSASGAFVQRLVEALPASVHSRVLVPAATGTEPGRRGRGVETFRYAPRRWQRLAHRPGGIPVALAEEPLLYLLVPFFLVAMAVACARRLRTAQLVHAHWSVTGVVGGVVARLLGKAAVTTLWGEDVTRTRDSTAHRWLLWACLHLNDRVVAVSEAMRDQVAARYPRLRSRLEVVPNGVADALVGLPAPDRAGGPLQVLCVGSLIPRKGLATVIRALARLGQGWHLTLVGDGPDRPSLTALARELGLESRVEFAGGVPPDAVPAFYSRADVLVLASRSEGMPSVVLEAMAAALPVVATDIDGVRELLGDREAGALFPVDDDAALARELQTLGSDAVARRRRGLAARQVIIRRQLLWSQIGTRYAAVYAGAMGA